MHRFAPALLVGLCCLGGCYAYTPSGVREVAPEQKVRVRLSPGETARLQEYVNPETRTLTGRVVDATHNEPLYGVNITIGNTGRGTISGLDGRFSRRKCRIGNLA